MTFHQANKFLNKIQKGYFFVSRFLDQEWSIWPLEDDKFETKLTEQHKDTKIFTESREEVVRALTKYDYSFKEFSSKLHKYTKPTQKPLQ